MNKLKDLAIVNNYHYQSGQDIEALKKYVNELKKSIYRTEEIITHLEEARKSTLGPLIRITDECVNRTNEAFKEALL